MEGGNQLWLRVRQGLDQISFEAFRSLYATGTDPDVGRGWCVNRCIEELLEGMHPSEVSAEECDIVKMHEVPQPSDEVDDMETATFETLCVGRKTLRMIAFGMPDEPSNSITTAYGGQLTVKIDPENEYLIYEAFEAPPSFFANYKWPITEKQALPIVRSFESYPGEDSDLEDEDLDNYVDPDTDKMKYYVMNLFAKFRETRIMRARVSMESITKMHLVEQSVQYAPDEHVEQYLKGTWRPAVVTSHTGAFIKLHTDGEDRMALPQHVRPLTSVLGVLILELSEPIESFATRAVYSCTVAYNRPDMVGDWTPDCSGTESLRHYVVGDILELRAIVNQLYEAMPSLKTVMTKGKLSLEELLPANSPIGDLPPPSRRRAPLWSGVEDLEEAMTAPKAEVKAETRSVVENLAQAMEKRREEENEEREVTALVGLQKEPDFQFPKRPDAEDAVLARATAWLEGKGGNVGKKGNNDNGDKNAQEAQEVEAQEHQQEEIEQIQEGPAPPPPATLVRTSSRGLTSSTWSCGACGKGGLLLWVRRCPDCGIALVPPRRKLPTVAQSTQQADIPETWEDEA